jgi:hypothetical protein
MLTLRKVETDDRLILDDGSLAHSRKRDFSWSDAHIHAARCTINKKSRSRPATLLR